MPKVGAFGLPDSSADSILLQRLEPGAYTCVINGTGDGEGVVLTEIYEVTDR